MGFDPWFELETRWPGVEVVYTRLNGKVAGLTNGVDRIWLEERLDVVEQRCVLTHEIVHLEMGHTECQPLKIELQVCRRTARLLISLEDLADAWKTTSNLFELAEELNVMPQTLRNRLHGLRDDELLVLERRDGLRLAS